MAPRKPNRDKSARKSNGKTQSLRAHNEQLQKELNELRQENRYLKKSLGAILSKDVPKNMDFTPEDGVAKPSLLSLIAKLERTGKRNVAQR